MMAAQAAAAIALLACSAGALSHERLPLPAAEASSETLDLGHFHCRSSKVTRGIWKPPRWNSSSRRNICLKDRQVPDVYLLGAAKCATTSLAYELISAGSQCAGDIKEYHFFEKPSLRAFAADSGAVTDQWLEGMPPCDAPHRTLLGDFSPENLALTDSPGFPSGSTKHSVPELPVVLGQMYKGHASKINFLIMIRDPLARAHSFMHYGRTLGPGVFQAELEHLLNTFTPDKMFSGRNGLWGSHYGFQLERWLEVFSHRQFYVIPYKAFGAGDAHRICKDLRKRLHHKIDCGPARVPNQLNRGVHTKLLDETNQEVRDRFHEFMTLDRRRLLHHLAMGSHRGMGLALYDGHAGDKKAIGKWLFKWW